jgi:translation initiation factor 2A
VNSLLAMLQGTPDMLNQASSPETNSGLTPTEKRLRTLKKKLQQITTLKDKQLNGEKLEDTQVTKQTCILLNLILTSHHSVSF